VSEYLVLSAAFIGAPKSECIAAPHPERRFEMTRQDATRGKTPETFNDAQNNMSGQEMIEPISIVLEC
jgi:hypothetical protein